jgi:hypothetical protein
LGRGKIREGGREVHVNRNRYVDDEFHYSVLLMVMVMVKPLQAVEPKRKEKEKKIPIQADPSRRYGQREPGSPGK